MKIYFKIIGILFTCAVVFGIVLPWLFSAKQTEAVLFGVFLLVAVIPVLFLLCKSLFNEFIEKEKRNEEN